jgi:hypothetical protein
MSAGFGFDPGILASSIMESMPQNMIKTDLGADPQRLIRIFHDSLEAFEEGMKGDGPAAEALRKKGLEGLNALCMMRSLGVTV